MNEVQLARYDRMFDAYAGPDGNLTWATFTAHVQPLAAQRGLASDSLEVINILGSLLYWWDYVCAASDTNRDGQVGRDEWHAFCEATHTKLCEAAAAGEEFPFNPWVRALFRIIDGDHDGRITPLEYERWLTSLGLADDTDIAGAFAGFDKNDDGWLSWQEFAAASAQYWTDFDPAVPGARWLGP